MNLTSAWEKLHEQFVNYDDIKYSVKFKQLLRMPDGGTPIENKD